MTAGGAKRPELEEGNRILPDVALSSAKDPKMIESKHRRIVEGACEIFYRNGYHPTTIREIAAGSGMSMGQLYHYVSCKDDVLYLVHRHFHRTWQEFLKGWGAQQFRDPVDRFVAGLRENLRFVQENQALVRFIFTESKYLNEEHLQVVLSMDKDHILRYYEELLQDINRERPIEADLTLLAGIIEYLVMFIPLRRWSAKHRSKDEITDYLVDFVMRGVGFSPPGTGREGGADVQ